MNKKVKRTGAFILCLLLIGAFSFNFRAYAEDSENEESVYYCREALRSLPNSKALLYAYDSIVSGVEASADSISVYDGKNAITVNEINTVIDAYTRDHTEHFWLGKEYSLTAYQQSKNVTHVNPTYTMSGDELVRAKADFNNAINELASCALSAASEYEKELILHDNLAARVAYEEGEHAHDAYGALVIGTAVCEGYAEALQCLLHAVDIRSLIATGYSVNPSTNSNEGHAWNIARIDGKYYHTDLTWNDQSSTLFHAYFNLTDAAIKADHLINEPSFALPMCDSVASNYFVKENSFLTQYNVNLLAHSLKNNNLLITVYILDGKEQFIYWLDANIADIAKEVGISGAFSYSYLTLGGEVILNIDACLHDTLAFVPEKPMKCTEDGNLAHYVCEECDKYFYDSEAEEVVLTPEILFISAPGHNFVNDDESEELLRSAPENCLSAFTYWHRCTRCAEISDVEYSESEARGPHSPGEPATTEKEQTCTLCGDVLAPKLHTHSLTLVPEKEPSCTQDGKKEYYVCDCGKCFIDSEAKGELINVNNYGKLDALGHGEVDFAGKCSRCGELIKPINALTVSVGVGALALILLVGVISVFKKRRTQRFS